MTFEHTAYRKLKGNVTLYNNGKVVTSRTDSKVCTTSHVHPVEFYSDWKEVFGDFKCLNLHLKTDRQADRQTH